jgi:hypothetical protein
MNFFGSLGTKINIIQEEDIDISRKFTEIFSKKYNVCLGYETEFVSSENNNNNNDDKNNNDSNNNNNQKFFHVIAKNPSGKSIHLIQTNFLLLLEGFQIQIPLTLKRLV